MVALRNFSASQVNAFNNCKRVWFLQWVLGIKGEQTDAQKRGVEIHEILEYYLRHGVIKPAFEINPSKYEKHELGYERYVEWCIPYLPDPEEPHLAVEQQVFLDTPSGERIDGYHAAEGIPLVGYIDMGRWSLEIPEVWDLKTTSNMRYVKTPAELHQDVQLNTYARWVFQVEPTLNEIKCGHIYVKVEAAGKKAPKTVRSKKVIPVHTTITRESNNEYWARDAATMGDMVALAESFDKENDDEDAFLQSIQPNVNFCSSYGGCAHRERCGISVQETLYQPARGKIDMSFMDKVKAKRAADAAAGGSTEAPAPDASQAAAAAEPPPPPAPKPKPAAKPKSAAASFKDRLKNKPVNVATEEPPTSAAEAQEPAVAAASDLLPPDAPTRETSAERSEELRGEAQAKADKKAADKAKKTTKKTTKSKSKHKREFTLYFGCTPTKGEHQSFIMVDDWIQDILAGLNEQVAESTKHTDYRLLGYAEEKVALAGAVQAKVESGDIPDALVCLTGGQAREVANLLMPVATDVVMVAGK